MTNMSDCEESTERTGRELQRTVENWIPTKSTKEGKEQGKLEEN
jgi:hypothetical protein